MYGLAFAYMELSDIEQAQKHFQKVPEIEAPEDLRGRGWMRSSICWIPCGRSA
jgi:hypothetical protein